MVSKAGLCLTGGREGEGGSWTRKFVGQKNRPTTFSQLQNLLPSARHLEEGRGTSILELPRLENCISRLCPRPLGSPPPHTQIG